MSKVVVFGCCMFGAAVAVMIGVTCADVFSFKMDKPALDGRL